MAAAAYLTLESGKGDDLVVDATHVVSASDSTPVNIAGWTIKVNLRWRVTDDDTFTEIAATVVNGAAGTYTWEFTAALLRTMRSGDWAMSVFRTDTGSERLMATGILTIDANARYGF